MVSTFSYFLLFGIITLIHGNINYYNERAEGLIPKLSNLKGKYGLNFAHVEGIGSLPKHYKESHPKLTYMDHNPQTRDSKNKPADINNIDMYNLLVAAKVKSITRSRDKYCDETGDELRKILRICRKKPKEYHCKPENECDVASEPEEESDSYEAFYDTTKKKRYNIKKKRYFRTDDAKAHETVDETASLLDDLEKILAGNDKYRVFLGCVGRMCGGRTHKDRYDEDGDDTEIRRNDLGSVGDRRGRSRDEDDDIDHRRY